MADHRSELRAWTRFTAIFLAVFVGLYALYTLLEPLLEGYYAFLAHSVAAVLAHFDPQVSARDNVILYGAAGTLRVVEGCDGVTVFILIAAALAAYPRPWRSRLFGIVGFVGLLFVVNWLRLVLLAFVRFYLPEHFHWVHVYLFQSVMIFTTLALFILWAGRGSSVRASA